MTEHFTIRPATKADHGACEALIRDAFWNLYRPGCHEHYLWRLATQGHPDVMEALTLVATCGDELVGCVMSTRAHVETPDDMRIDVLAPGPLAVAPASQGQGVGTALLNETLVKARAMGERAAFLYGNPGYYPRFGFKNAEAFGITTAEGDNFPDFMGLELTNEALAGVTGRLVESTLFDVDAKKLDEFDASFPPRVKAKGSRQL